MIKEFNLSEKIWEDMYIGKPEDYKREDILCLSVKDVKEFIIILKEKFKDNFVIGQYFEAIIKPTIDKLAGDKLK